MPSDIIERWKASAY